MLKGFDDGRSKSFYCITATLLPITALETSLEKTEQKMEIDEIQASDAKAKSRILRTLLNEFAFRDGITLRLRKKARD